MTEAAQATVGPAPATVGAVRPARAWYVVGLLCLLSVISYLDRYIIALLAEPISIGMKVNDTQIGLLMGLGFGVLYALIGLPIAHLLDTRSRVAILALSVALWSLSTCASAFTNSFGMLALCRAGVAIGEAALTPAAISLIADMFLPKRRTLPTAMFMAIAAVMSSGAFIIGGAVYDIAGSLEGRVGMEPWRLTMLLLGLPGLLVVPIWLSTVREPRRGAGGEAEASVPMREALAYFVLHIRLYGFLFLGLCASSIANFAFVTWTATVLKRSFGMTLAEAGVAFGSSSLIGGLGCALFFPAMHAFAVRRGHPSAIILMIAAGFAIGGTALASYGLAADASQLLLLATVAAFGFNVTGTPSVLAIQAVAPARVRARIIAMYVMAISLIGFTVGPPLGAAIGEALFTGPDALRRGLALLPLFMSPLAVISAIFCHRAYVPAIRTLQA